MSWFPFFADLNDKPVLLVGAGEVATRKAESLLAAGAQLQVVVARTLAPPSNGGCRKAASPGWAAPSPRRIWTGFFW